MTQVYWCRSVNYGNLVKVPSIRAKLGVRPEGCTCTRSLGIQGILVYSMQGLIWCPHRPWIWKLAGSKRGMNLGCLDRQSQVVLVQPAMHVSSCRLFRPRLPEITRRRRSRLKVGLRLRHARNSVAG